MECFRKKIPGLKTQTIPYKKSIVSYLRLGSGPRVLVCFHGYGESANAFHFLERAKSNHSIIAIDLPFHGDGAWNETQFLSANDLVEIIDIIIRKEEFLSDRFSLCGFSLGGRVALSLFERIPDRIESVTLLAPDGLKLNFWYWFATQTSTGRRLFLFTMKQPSWFFLFLSLLHKLRFVNASFYKFVRYYVGDHNARMLLYNRWNILRGLRPNIKAIRKSIKDHQTRVVIVYGKHDRIILPSRGEKFRKGIVEYCTIKIISAGHQVLHEKHANELFPILFR